MTRLVTSIKIKVPVIILWLVGLSQVVSAQASNSKLTCDLTYKSIMEQNKVDKIEWVQRWFATYDKPPAKKWIEGWKDEPFISWVLIEHPNFHASERTTLWLARTKSRAVYWESVQVDYHSVDEIEKRTQRQEIKPDIYDKFFKTVSEWKQAKVLKPKQPLDGFTPEFWGFLSVSSSDGSCKQMLLGWNDFMGCHDCKPGPKRRGRLMIALLPMLEIEDHPKK